jgi:hypothetical protein
MAGVRITSNRIVVLDEAIDGGNEKIRLSAIRFAVISSVTDQNPDFPAGRHAVRIIA